MTYCFSSQNFSRENLCFIEALWLKYFASFAKYALVTLWIYTLPASARLLLRQLPKYGMMTLFSEVSEALCTALFAAIPFIVKLNINQRLKTPSDILVHVDAAVSGGHSGCFWLWWFAWQCSRICWSFGFNFCFSLFCLSSLI